MTSTYGIEVGYEEHFFDVVLANSWNIVPRDEKKKFLPFDL
jgi:hypothetical protein